jgi:hypothetical protein
MSVPIRGVGGPPFTAMVPIPLSSKVRRKGPAGVKADVPGANIAASVLALMPAIMNRLLISAVVAKRLRSCGMFPPPL